MKRFENKKEIEYLLGLTSGTLSRREGIMYAECLTKSGSSLSNGTSSPSNPNFGGLNPNSNEEVFEKLDISILNSQNCVQAASESLNIAQRMMEKVEENMILIARNECEVYYTRTIREVDEKV